MRRNTFGDAYCHTADEVRSVIESRAGGGVYVPGTSFDPPESSYKATCEVVSNGDGETVCYIEADTLDAVRAIVKQLKLEVQ